MRVCVCVCVCARACAYVNSCVYVIVFVHVVGITRTKIANVFIVSIVTPFPECIPSTIDE